MVCRRSDRPVFADDNNRVRDPESAYYRKRDYAFRQLDFMWILSRIFRKYFFTFVYEFFNNIKKKNKTKCLQIFLVSVSKLVPEEESQYPSVCRPFFRKKLFYKNRNTESATYFGKNARDYLERNKIRRRWRAVYVIRVNENDPNFRLFFRQKFKFRYIYIHTHCTLFSIVFFFVLIFHEFV